MSIANVRISCIHSETEWQLTLQASPSTGTIALINVRTSTMSVTHVNISFISTEARSELTLISNIARVTLARVGTDANTSTTRTHMMTVDVCPPITVDQLAIRSVVT